SRMSQHARALLAAHLKQRREAGDRLLFLETFTASELLAHAKSAGVRRPVRSARSEAVAPAGDGIRSETGPERDSALTVLGDEVRACTACRLHATRNSVVFGVGNPNADVVVVGEAPGHEEDRRGEPFVGRAGKLLDR